MSANHSGSTLLSHLLNAHTKIFGLSEIEKIGSFIPMGDRALCTCKKTYDVCDFWGDLTRDSSIDPLVNSQFRQVYRNNMDFILDRKKFKFKTREPYNLSLKEYLDSLKFIYRYALEKSGSTYVVDSTKNIDQLGILSKESDVSLCMIHLIREPGGVAWSYQRKYGSWFYGTKHWLKSNFKSSLIKRRLQRLRVNVVTLSYSSLIRDPEATLKDLCHKIGIPFESGMLDYSSAEHHFCGGNRRTSVKTDKVIGVDNWREKMSLFKKVVVFAVAGWVYFLMYKKK